MAQATLDMIMQRLDSIQSEQREMRAFRKEMNDRFDDLEMKLARSVAGLKLSHNHAFEDIADLDARVPALEKN